MKIETIEEKASYGIGLELGQQLKVGGFQDHLVPAAIAEGIQHILSGTHPVITLEEVTNALKELKEKTDVVRENIAKVSAEASKKFLEENAQKENVVVLPSGVQYIILDEGVGQKPTEVSKIRVHYSGKNIKDQVFDSSLARGEPVEFDLANVVPGLKEAFLLMSEGAKWRVFIPSELGYKEQNGGPLLPPNSALIFDLHLLQILN